MMPRTGWIPLAFTYTVDDRIAAYLASDRDWGPRNRQCAADSIRRLRKNAHHDDWPRLRQAYLEATTSVRVHESVDRYTRRLIKEHREKNRK